MSHCRVFGFVLGVVLLWGPAPGQADPPPFPPFSIRGHLTVNGIPVFADTGAAYIVTATREDRTHFEPSVVCDLGEGYFRLDIPVRQSGSTADGAIPGESLLLHVYWRGSKLLVTAPAGAMATVGGSGEVRYLDIAAMTGPGTPQYYTQEELDAAVAEAVRRWDAGGDGRIGLEEAIRALRIVSGAEPAEPR